MFNLSLNVRHAVRLAIAGAAAAASTAALAQTAAVSTPPAKELEEVIVTGTRIQQSPNSVSIAPVASITADDIAKSGLVRTEDLLNNLPQVIAEQGSGQSISADGTASVSLRGLGSFRTLVLINGRRMQPGGGIINASSPDINQIPAAMVERVDVLTGGASATYGADAVAGVVNFIMNTHFEGVRLDFDYGQNMYGQTNDFAQAALVAKGITVPGSFTGGQNRDWSFMAGANFADGKGNATVYGTYLNTSPVTGSQLDYAGCTLNSASAAPKPPATVWKPVTCGGSSSSATGRFLLLGKTANSSYATLADGTVDKTTGLFRQYTSADSYNYGAASYAQREAQRYTAGAFLNYDVNESVNVYSETMFARNTSTAQYGSSGLFAFGTPSISCSNPLLNPSELATLCTPGNIAANQATFGGTGDRITVYAARRSVESGPRLDNYSSDSIREVIGAKGGWGEAWTYDVYGQYGISALHDNQGGYLGSQQINNALDVIPNPATGGVKGVAAGAPVCAITVAGYDPACVPWNIWNTNGVTPAQLAYLTVQSTYDVTATEFVVDGSVTGDLGKYGIKIPTAATGIDVNLGTEYRQESYKFEPDYVFSHGYASGGNGAATAIDGTFHVNEYFFETRVPIADNLPGIYHLGFEGGYRYSDYTSGFTTDTFKLGLEWAPIQDIKLRGSFNRAVRAPSIGDLFSPAVVGAGGTADPCWSATPSFSLQQCINTGMKASQYTHILANPAAQINTTAGGNVNLKPEKADTYTVGFVLQPLALQGFSMSLDYYDIKINDTIANLTSNTVLTNCANTGDPQLCGLIHRDPNTGSLWFNNNDFVNTNSVNIGTIVTKGYDLAARYAMNAGNEGKLAFTLSGTYVTDWSTQPLPTGGSFDCTGLYGATCGAPTPKWRHTFETDWATPWAGLTLAARWRYIGPVDVDSTSSNSQLSGAYQPGFSHIGGYDYIDLSGSISWGAHLTFRAGVNNITDKGPPIVLNGNYSNCPNTTCNDNTWVGTYDTLGRYLFVHVSAKF
jgi:iron complex outermembrane recepter protein